MAASPARMAQPFGAARRFFAAHETVAFGPTPLPFGDAVGFQRSSPRRSSPSCPRAKPRAPSPFARRSSMLGRSHEARSHGSVRGSRAVAPDGPGPPGVRAAAPLLHARLLAMRTRVTPRSHALESNGWTYWRCRRVDLDDKQSHLAGAALIGAAPAVDWRAYTRTHTRANPPTHPYARPHTRTHTHAHTCTAASPPALRPSPAQPGYHAQWRPTCAAGVLDSCASRLAAIDGATAQVKP